MVDSATLKERHESHIKRLAMRVIPNGIALKRNIRASHRLLKTFPGHVINMFLRV